jgi:ATP-dependent DNA helicase RecG
MTENQRIEWKKSWPGEYLKWVCVFANAQGGLESGRGIQRVFEACRAAGTPQPLVQVEPGELWFEFPFAPAYLESIFSGKTTQETTQETPVKTPVETRVETPVKTPERILEVLRANPRLTLAEVAGRIGKSMSAVERASAKLVREGRLRYVGPRKGGHWEVLGGSS